MSLYICATPIGNLEDVSSRLIRILGEVDVIAAEDTRRTRQLLNALGLKGRLVSYRDATEQTQTTHLLNLLKQGKDVALVSDGGTPLVSDPGYRIVRACIEEGIKVEVVPGPTSVIAALVLSGLPTARFAFEGFLPRKLGEMRSLFRSLAADQRTLIFFESPRRVTKSLPVMLEGLGNRNMALVREISKVYEEVIRGTVSEVIASIGDNAVLGEVVLVVEGTKEQIDAKQLAIEMAVALVRDGTAKSRAAQEAARTHGVSKTQIYRALLD
ncbi:MAG: 16S rRNA (cytidine(1402)-2'-O)-methyltransferase [Actinomycetota bacterium]